MTFKLVRRAAAFALVLALPATALAQSMLTQTASPHTHAETVQRLEKAIEARGLTMVAKVDHAAAAAKAGMKLPPTVLLIFGNPKGGTPLMQAAPSMGIDLPMKALVWQDAGGKVQVAVNSMEFYRRHGLKDEQLKPLEAVSGLVNGALK
ncbi:DUF302 domain-containing protein [Methylibium sp.]|uniref:DUF302 domain-containing protein n=1 Tax=Methylibium sp. TaxID=2067992 RepID=UPI0025DFC535|nr:DUF302 domain-containing protein [Methylibium sp.]